MNEFRDKTYDAPFGDMGAVETAKKNILNLEKERQRLLAELATLERNISKNKEQLCDEVRAKIAKIESSIAHEKEIIVKHAVAALELLDKSRMK